MIYIRNVTKAKSLKEMAFENKPMSLSQKSDQSYPGTLSYNSTYLSLEIICPTQWTCIFGGYDEYDGAYYYISRALSTRLLERVSLSDKAKNNERY